MRSISQQENGYTEGEVEKIDPTLSSVVIFARKTFRSRIVHQLIRNSFAQFDCPLAIKSNRLILQRLIETEALEKVYLYRHTDMKYIKRK